MVKTEKLTGLLAEKSISFPKAANSLGIGKKAFYCKMRGESQFKQKEIVSLKNLLGLSDAELIDIFFA